MINKQFVFTSGGILIISALAVYALSPFIFSKSTKSVDASYEYLQKKKVRKQIDNAFPEELNATIIKRNDTWVADGPVKPAQITALIKKSRPEILKFRSSEIDANGLALLEDAGLEELRIIFNILGAAEFDTISKMDGLKRLYLEENQITGAAISHLTGPKSLQVLVYKKNPADAALLETVSQNFKNLEILIFHTSDVAYKDLLPLKNLKNRLQLGFTSCPNIKSPDITKLKKLSSKLIVHENYGLEASERHDKDENSKKESLKELFLQKETK